MENKQSPDLKEDGENRILEGIKQNLILSILSHLWNKISEESSEIEKNEFQKLFIHNWKKNMTEVTQVELDKINKILNDNNIDMLNIITGEKQIPDVEDYQQILNNSINEVEKIYWKICGK